MLTQRLGSSRQIEDEYIDSILAMAKEHPGSCDEVWFASLYGYPPMEKHGELVKKMLPQVEKFRKAGIRVSMQISNTIGHGDYVSQEDCSGLVYENSPVGHLVGPDGTVGGYSFCWNSEVFREYIRETIKSYLILKPEVIWFDDDFRPHHHTPVTFGCFCDDCIRKFNESYGSQFTREELVNELSYGDLACRKAFIDFTKAGIARLMNECCEVIHKELPNTRIGIQQGTFGGFMGDSGNRFLYETAYQASGLPVSCRPGGGAYTDQDMRAFIQKGNEVERQIRECPEFVSDFRPEVENLPYVAFGKSAAATLFETTYYMAVGATAMSYAMLMSAREELGWYDKFFEGFSSHREYWEKLSEYNRKTAQCGINAVYPDNRWAIQSKEKLAYTESDKAEEQILRYVGLPLAYRMKFEGTHVLHGSDGARISDQTVQDLLAKPVLTDAEAIAALMERGYQFDISVEPIDTLQLYEGFTDHEINRGVYLKQWVGKFAGKRSGYRIDCLSETVEVVGRYKADVPGTANEGTAATVVFTTSKGAKWAVFGFDLWNRIINTSRRDQLVNVVEYISGSPLPAKIQEAFAAIVLPRTHENGKLASVSVVNCMPDESGEYHLKLQVPEGTKALYMSQYGRKEECTVGKDGILKMPSLKLWNVATVFFAE